MIVAEAESAAEWKDCIDQQEIEIAAHTIIIKHMTVAQYKFFSCSLQYPEQSYELQLISWQPIATFLILFF